jgi:hypothetical protein
MAVDILSLHKGTMPMYLHSTFNMACGTDIMSIAAIIGSVDKSTAYLREKGLLHDGHYCMKCSIWMSLVKDKSREHDGYVWRCKLCKSKISVRADAFWATLKINLNVAVFLLYLFARDVQLCIAVTLFNETINEKTVSDYYNLYRDLMSRDMIDNPAILGGPGVIVELDESKYGGKRKDNNGRKIAEGYWVFGMLDRDTKKAVVFQVADRSRDTLTRHIQEHIADGTIIHTDGWAAYGNIPTLPNNYTHYVVNHKENYVDPEPTHNLWKICGPIQSNHGREHEGTPSQCVYRTWMTGHGVGTINSQIVISD